MRMDNFNRPYASHTVEDYKKEPVKQEQDIAHS